MNKSNDNGPLLTSFTDTAIFEEAAMRLKKQFRSSFGVEFLYGCFEFIFHEGRFQGIEERPRNKRYRSPGRLTQIASN